MNAQHGGVDSNGDIVDRAAEVLLDDLLERLRGAICLESPIDLDAHLSWLTANLLQAVTA